VLIKEWKVSRVVALASRYGYVDPSDSKEKKEEKEGRSRDLGWGRACLLAEDTLD